MAKKTIPVVSCFEDRFSVRRVVDGKYLSIGIASCNRAELMWDSGNAMADVWDRDQAQAMVRVIHLIWDEYMDLELEPVAKGGEA